MSDLQIYRRRRISDDVSVNNERNDDEVLVDGEKGGAVNAVSHTWLLLLKRELSSQMVRKLKFHEQKLLKKVDFLNVCPNLYDSFTN